jgi:hypothetical protein
MPWVTPWPNTINVTQSTWVNTLTVTTSSFYPLYVNQTSTMMYPQTASLTNMQNIIWVDEPRTQIPGNITVVSERPASRMMRPPPRPPAEPRSPTAFDRARELLLSHLTEEQRATFIENRWFVVIGGRSRMRYRIETGHLVANVRRLNDNLRLCAHCDHSLPMDDHLIAQKLMLEYDEDAFLAIANRH